MSEERTVFDYIVEKIQWPCERCFPPSSVACEECFNDTIDEYLAENWKRMVKLKFGRREAEEETRKP
jgi:hypothetical protein